MATNVIMPALGVAQQTGTLLKWLKNEGQSVAQGEPLMEIETDKATVEIEAPASGTLAGVAAKPGDEVPVGQRIAFILAPGEALPKRPVEPPTVSQPRHEPPPRDELGARSSTLPQVEGITESRLPFDEKETSRARALGEADPPSATAVREPTVGHRILASPKARRLARESGIDLATLRGSGPDGSVLAQDVLPVQPGSSTGALQDVVPLTPMRRIVGQRMTQSKQTAPHFYLTMDIDMSAPLRFRARQKEHSEPPASINDFILFACARGLKAFPSLNSSYSEQEIKLHRDIHIGMAVALDDGLVVPVIRNADRLSLNELSQQSRELADKAKNKKLLPSEYEGGTFTVSNLGMLGVDSFVAIINPPQCAILAVGRVAPRVIADEIGMMIRPMMHATLSADHRIVDGAVAARFSNHVKRILEQGSFEAGKGAGHE
jgi:pyruvate dehydrogenase E2 component (dihydrolipoamide acetyltransferase)